ncbi:MAG: hypothetical protein LBJ60_02880 [Tannerellaceae bacterium]|jgi:hypothetical protein|nr:hypothetical protein [Tannerellaceae bacterium]
MFLTNYCKKKFLFLLGMTLFIATGSAQIHIGSQDPPHSSAALEISSDNKGVLLPEVALTSVSDIAVIENNNPVDGLLVYNTKEDAPKGLYKGLYAWSNMKKRWEQIVSKRTFDNMLQSFYALEQLSFAANDVSGQAVASYVNIPFKFNSQQISENSGNCFDTGNNCFVVPKAGFYKILCGMELTHSQEDKDDVAEIRLKITTPANQTSQITVSAVRNYLLFKIDYYSGNRLPLTPSIIHTGRLDAGTKITVEGYNGANSAGTVKRKYFNVSTF